MWGNNRKWLIDHELSMIDREELRQYHKAELEAAPVQTRLKLPEIHRQEYLRLILEDRSALQRLQCSEMFKSPSEEFAKERAAVLKMSNQELYQRFQQREAQHEATLTRELKNLGPERW